MATDDQSDIWGGLDDDDFLSINVSEEQIGTNINAAQPPTPSTSKFTTLITSVSSLGVRLTDLVEAASKKQKQDNGSNVIYVQANAKRKVYRRRKTVSKGSPLHRLKYGRLWVTDIATQFWCELQMVFKYEPPPALVGIEIIPSAEVTVGKSLHLVRELQVEKPVFVKVTSSEDRFALKVLSLLNGVTSIVKHGKLMRREIHIFGAPFNMGVYVSGIIDEIRCHQETLELEIVEFKTRTKDSMPTAAQKLTHNIQVMLYKRLFDEMVTGQFSKETVAKHFRMNLYKTLGKNVVDQIMHEGVDTLSKLLDLLVETMKGVPFISNLLVEYALQKNGTTIGYSKVEYDEEWLIKKLTHAFGYWKGERSPLGVTIEDCWKCIRCDYSKECKWKSALVKKYSLVTVAGVQPPKELPATQEEKLDPWNSTADSIETTFSSESEATITDDSGIGNLPSPKEQNISCNEPNDIVVIFPVVHDHEVEI